MIFIDESGFSTKMARSRGWSAKGKRLVSAVPHGHWHNNTFIAGLRTEGVIAPRLLDGPMNGEKLREWLKEELSPCLRYGDIVIMDNLPAHKSGAVRDIIEGEGANLFYLPPYSPDLNPIEMTFSKIKAGLRKAAKRTFEGLSSVLQDILATITQKECQNYIRHAGYEPY